VGASESASEDAASASQFVDIKDKHDEGPDGRRMSVSARHEAVLADGRRVVLLDDRGWTGELRVAEGGTVVALPGIWAHEAVEEIERTARFVVGPDEPFEGRTQAEMEASHWDSAMARPPQGVVHARHGRRREVPPFSGRHGASAPARAGGNHGGGDIAARREHHFRVMIRTPMSLVATEAVSVGLQILALTWFGEGTVIAMRISPDGSGTVP
jgi:hypothetical protein